jgi:hypothetical protein
MGGVAAQRGGHSVAEGRHGAQKAPPEAQSVNAVARERMSGLGDHV